MSQAKTDTQFELLEKIESLIRAGKISEAQGVIKKAVKSKVNRNFRLRLAALCRRTNQNQTSIRLLNPIVRPKIRKIGESATEEERVEYAASLIRLGASGEAFEILENVNPDTSQKALFFLAIANFGKWNYEAAIPCLRKYLSYTSLSPYDRTVGEVNLLSALIHEKHHKEAVILLEKLNEDAAKNGLKYVQGKLLHYEAELAINEGQYDFALEKLKFAREQMNQASPVEQLFIRKWESIAKLSISPKSKVALSEHHKVRNDATRLKHWETVRNCDFYEAFLTRNKSLALHVYFGTPYEAYRQHLLKQWGATLELPETYEYNLGSKKDKEVLDFENIEKSEGYLSSKRPMYHLFRVLSSDFYAPFRLIELHALVFENDYFNPDTSPLRMRKAIQRMRLWLEKSSKSLTVLQEDHRYRLGGEAVLKIRLERETNENERMLKTILKNISPVFSAKEAAVTLKCGRRTANRMLEEMTKSGVLIRTGQGPATKYQLVSSDLNLKKAS